MAVKQLAEKVEAQEPGTLSYLVHVPSAISSLQSLPPADPLGLLFFEIYRDANAFMDHLHGPLFKRFLEDHLDYPRSSRPKPLPPRRPEISERKPYMPAERATFS